LSQLLIFCAVLYFRERNRHLGAISVWR